MDGVTVPPLSTRWARGGVFRISGGGGWQRGLAWFSSVCIRIQKSKRRCPLGTKYVTVSTYLPKLPLLKTSVIMGFTESFWLNHIVHKHFYELRVFYDKAHSMHV